WQKEFVVQETLSNWAPALGSMWLSTLTAGFAQIIGGGAIAWTADKVFDVKHVQLSTFMKPAKFGVRLGGVTVQTALFLGFDKIWNPMVVAPWKNHFDGGYISKLDKNVTNIMEDYQANGWRKLSPEECESYKNKDNMCERDLVYNLKKLQQRLSDWRNFNMTDVQTQHANWQQMVLPATTMMYASESFYRQFLRAVETGKDGVLGEKLIYAYPLYGITPDNLNMEMLRPLFEKHHEEIIPAQMATIKKVIHIM
ncbi:MAG: hypothetical protein V4736_08465, partial [Bdellovibrionota bacterium]